MVCALGFLAIRYLSVHHYPWFFLFPPIALSLWWYFSCIFIIGIAYTLIVRSQRQDLKKNFKFALGLCFPIILSFLIFSQLKFVFLDHQTGRVYYVVDRIDSRTKSYTFMRSTLYERKGVFLEEIDSKLDDGRGTLLEVIFEDQKSGQKFLFSREYYRFGEVGRPDIGHLGLLDGVSNYRELDSVGSKKYIELKKKKKAENEEKKANIKFSHEEKISLKKSELEQAYKNMIFAEHEKATLGRSQVLDEYTKKYELLLEELSILESSSTEKELK